MYPKYFFNVFDNDRIKKKKIRDVITAPILLVETPHQEELIRSTLIPYIKPHLERLLRSATN